MDFKTPQQIAQQYRLHLKTLKPEVNIEQRDSDWFIRSQVVGGVFSGIYADQRKLSNDPFPQSARREAIEKHLVTYFGSGFTQPTQAIGVVRFSGILGSAIPLGTQLEYLPNGNLYTTTQSVVIGSGGTIDVPVTSVDTGQIQNLLGATNLSLPSPPGGVNSTAITVGEISDGRDIESTDQAAQRILTQVRTPLAGGKVNDYIQFALAADPSVTSANVIRFPFGFGSVAVIITAGTTDIDAAIDAGDPIVVIPSPVLIETVQDYIETQNPLTDCAVVLAPASVPIDVTVNVRYLSGDNSTIISGQTLTQEELVQREVRRAVYKTPPGGQQIGGSGFVIASEIEEVLDLNLSSDPYSVGNKAQILRDRQVLDLSATGANLQILGNQVAIPNTITVVEM